MTVRVLVTGADGFLGRSLVPALAMHPHVETVVALDVREVPPQRRVRGVTHRVQDVRDRQLVQTLRDYAIDTVVHLASIVTPGKASDREFEYSVDVGGSLNVIHACLGARVQHLVVSSSGAAYGYHPDNPERITEDQPLRGNEAFAYAYHKRLVEEMLAEARVSHPRLAQTVLRIGTILGRTVDNQITALFEKRRLLAIRGSASPFVFVWDEDLVALFVQAVTRPQPGTYNVAGDGALGVRELAQRLGKPVLELPAGLLRAALHVGRWTGTTRYGPEQLDFLRYRPVLDNTRLKAAFGGVLRKTSAEAFEAWRQARALRTRART
ncbi:SDR family oxidoreductase [Caldimonas caldifontis]|uniref:Epimerase n=1 Tax=Caldimonas caldifontis TaxID=1452508 RepID=A0A2S5SRQ4_9BURK|nr:SDR family oxidoreductase [Caldimonas caldifontis]PPE65386.1 epimerase [Caldimonas caldifontis]